MSRSRATAALAIAAALGVSGKLPQVVTLPPPYPMDDEPKADPGPQINPKTGQPYRGIPAQARRSALPIRMRYANGVQPEPIRKMLQDRREQAMRERAREREGKRAAAVVTTEEERR